MKTLTITILAFGIFLVGCGYKTDPVYIDKTNSAIKKGK